jgi:hypothetical protein
MGIETAIIGSAILGAASSRSAAKTQAGAAQQAADISQQQYEQTRQDLAPWRAAGEQALNKLIPMSEYQKFGMDQFQQDPGYAFRLSEGQKALDRSAAARGGLISGGAMKAAQRYGQEMGSQEFQNAYNRLAGIAQLGPSAAGVQNNLGTGYANQANQLAMTNAANQGNLALQRGNIAATQYGNYSNVLGNALSKYNFGGGGGNTYSGAGQVNPVSGEYMGSLEF